MHTNTTKNVSLITRVVGFTVALTLFACAPSDRAFEIATLSGNVENGHDLYTSFCADCHGPHGDDGHSVNLLRRQLLNLHLSRMLI